MNQPAGFCENCGTPLMPDSRFCEECGNPVITQSEEAVSKNDFQLPPPFPPPPTATPLPAPCAYAEPTATSASDTGSAKEQNEISGRWCHTHPACGDRYSVFLFKEGPSGYSKADIRHYIREA